MLASLAAQTKRVKTTIGHRDERNGQSYARRCRMVARATLVLKCINFPLVPTMVVDVMVPSHSVIRSHKKKIESSPSMIFPQGIETLRNAICTHDL
jgi:hypothetical protein